MEALRTVPTIAPRSLIRSHLFKPIFSLSFTHKKTKSKFTKFAAISPSVSTEEETSILDQDDKFDWFSHWYALMPVCDLDKRAPRGMKVLGIDVVVWWDRSQNTWKVFDDRCPHRLAPLSQGRIDPSGRLQCVYHGWCFGGSGDCKLIPQAPLDGPPVHSFPKACVAVYPSTVQNGIVWFWPNSDPQYKDILTKKKPPYVHELDDPSFLIQMYTRDISYGYEVLVENLLDPSHVPYAHYGLMKITPPNRVDREGGSPMDINIQKVDKNGFTATEPQIRKWSFVSPCLVQGVYTINETPNNTQEKLAAKPPRRHRFVFFCIPVSPGNSRLIAVSPRNFGLWIDAFTARWMHHIMVNLVIDSDLYLVRVQEEKLMDLGPSNWQKVSFVPTKADANVVAFRKWLKKYAGGQVNWGTKTNVSLPPIPPREQLMDRYRNHVLNCSSCNGAYKGLNAFKIFLQVFSVASVAIMAATKQGVISVATKNTLAAAAILCFVGSEWLTHFIYKNFHFHDYNHAFK